MTPVFKTPYHRWLTYMFAVEKRTVAEVHALLQTIHAAHLSEEALIGIREQAKAHRPKMKRQTLFSAWLRTYRLMDFHLNSEASRLARRLFDEYEVRRVMEMLLSARTEPTAVVFYLDKLLGVHSTEMAVSIYATMFWDMKQMSVPEWNRFADTHEDGKLLVQANIQRQPEYALWLLGYRVQQDRSQVFHTMFHEASMRFMETSFMPNGQGTAMSAKMWSEIAFGADDRLKEADNQTQAMLEDLTEIRIKLGRRDITSVDRLLRESGAATKGA